MAFVLTRPSSPLPREIHPQIGTDNLGAPHVNQTSGPSNHDIDMARDKDKPRVEILLDSPHIVLKGVGVDVEPVRLSGHVALYLTESTPIKEITLQFRGKARLPAPSSESIAINSTPLTYIVCTHDWSFLEGDKKGRAHMLKAGRHLFPFQLRIGGSLPSSINTRVFGGASVAYKLRAQAVRTGFYHHNLQAVLPVPILRTFPAEALEYQQTLEIENTWPEKLMYSIMVPHKAWAAGDKVTALVKFSPLVKGVSVISVSTAIHEQTKVYSRSGTQEHSRVVAIVKHDIFGSRAVEVETSRPGHSRAHSQSHSPVTPGGSSSGFSPHRTMSSTSAFSHHFSPTPSHSHSRPSTPPLPLSPTQNIEPTPRASEEVATTRESAEPENCDVVTYLSLSIPLTATPSHGFEPIIVSHRIRWSILILNLDGHTSELRCSLPLHILDHRLLAEARAFTAATRRLLLGGTEVPPVQEEEDIQLPSYKAHVRDRVANMYLPESATFRVTNPWVSHGANYNFHLDHPVPVTQLPSQSGYSTPLETHLSHLPHAPGSGSSTPLDWVNSELLLSLSDDLPSRLSSNSHTHPELNSDSEPRTSHQSRQGSRQGSSFPSRPTSPERDYEHSTSTIDATHIPVGKPNETYVHDNNASRNLPSLFQASMKPFSSFSGHWIPRAPYIQPSLSTSDVRRTPQMQAVDVPASDPHADLALLQRAFTEVPDYAVASRGFIGGVPPLSSMQGLPSYEETQRTRSESDLAGRFAQLGAMIDHHTHEMRHSPLSSNSSS